MVVGLDSKPQSIYWTRDRYRAAIATGIFDDCRVELLNGVISEMPPPSPEHEWLIWELANYLRSLLGSQAVLRENKAIELDKDTDAIPDIAIVKPDKLYKQDYPDADDIYLLVEVANSQPGRDTATKRLIYAAAGIVEYWVFDMAKQELRVFRDITTQAGVADYQVDIVWADDPLSMSALPNIAFDAARLKALMAD